MQPSLRSQITARRSYHRPLNEEGSQFETMDQMIKRVIRHQRWLWERAKGKELNPQEEDELTALSGVMQRYEGFVAGRTLWLGGTEISRTRESSQFNCSGILVKTVFDVVDVAWLLLQGAGVGFMPVEGVLNGFVKPITDIQVIRSTRTLKGGAENNTETWLSHSKTWIIQIGDSAQAWAKAIGKVIASKYPAKTLIFDLSQIRPAGDRLKGYGWISSGDEQLHKALLGISQVMNHAAGRLLSVIDILDIVNWIGTILSSRRSAELAMLPSTHSHLTDFVTAKQNHFEKNPQRAQSNNSIVFYEKPTRSELQNLFDLMVKSGGSEPGFINGVEAKRRAPDFAVLNPCAEAVLGDKSFCNLVELNLSAFNGRFNDLLDAIYLLSRANYRQTCVNLKDGLLQETWHELNNYLHLCGIGLTGFVQWEYQQDADRLREIYHRVRQGTDSMAEELDLPYSKRVSVVKPSGTLSKVFGCTEGIHKPLGRYIFNSINFSIHDPIVKILQAANYDCFENPYDKTGMVVRFPVCWDHVVFDNVNGLEINTESAVTQLERYRLLMETYVDQNVSITVSYDQSEIEEIIDWILTYWNSYVATAFLPRLDPTKTAADLGYPYLPQEVVSKETYEAYVNTLLPVTLNNQDSIRDLDETDCPNGVCPVR